VSKKWYDSLPPDLQRIVDRDGNRESMAIAPAALASINGARKDWVAGGGELITLPHDEQALMLKTLMAAGKRVAAAKPQVSAAFEVVTEAARRTR
jgi:TRAP-type C4-dicarboxylate transport system substrate-binding protein